MASIILASQSPRRKQLLEWAEIDFEIMIHPTDESFPAGLLPEQVAVHIALEKARAVQQQAGNRTIVAADTIVVLDNDIIGKPKDRQDAIQILTRLNGAAHQVITGVAIRNETKEISFYDVTHVDFHTLTQEQIIYYVDKYQPYDKAGAYAIQEWIGVIGIKSINGDFYNVMGLPVSRVVQALANF
ncbi:MAG TPA: Maf family protein [Flavisolibacter sp.]|jgi:septum formation protein|nr:Maf family protein [Flavisolibacter sp.]